MTDPWEFRECATCAAKPGCPHLCEVCQHNRTIVNTLKSHRDAARGALRDAQAAFRAVMDYVTGGE